MHTGWDDEQQRKIDTADELTVKNAALRRNLAITVDIAKCNAAENAKLRAQLAEAVQLLRDCTSAYVTADRLRALDRAESWVADYDSPDA